MRCATCIERVPAHLDARRLQTLGGLLLDKPAAQGFGTGLWTLKRIGVLNERRWGSGSQPDPHLAYARRTGLLGAKARRTGLLG
ncbi:MAG: hypothetical protein ACOVN7_02145, partial [Rubrivivax sp.]